MWQQIVNCVKFEGEKFRKHQETLGVERDIETQINGQPRRFVTVPAAEEPLIAGATWAESELAYPRQSISLNRNEVYRLMVQFQERALLYKKIAIGHSAALASAKDLLVSAEDLTLQNAVYRCIGEFPSVAPAILLLSGMIDVQTVDLAARLGVCIIISRLAPTGQAVQRAGEHNLTVVGFARGSHFTVYAGKIN